MRGAPFEPMELRREFEPTLSLFVDTGWRWVDDPENLPDDDNDD